LKTLYRNSVGELITRVTTVQREWSSINQQIIEGFDEEAAAVYLGRHCVNKMLYEEQKNIKHIVDRTLIKWAQLYANYAKGDESSFSLPKEMKRLPQLCFNLRRSHFVNRFGISLDESFFKGCCMNRESVANCLSMIQPVLLSYSLENESTDPVAVPLDEEEMKDDVILLLDTYFVVAEWYGATVKSWEDAGYHTQEGYEHIAELFNSPKIDIEEYMKYRFPVPNYYRIEPYHSKERYLKSRVNPKKGMGEEHENMITDHSDLRTFTEHLIRAVVNQT
jgi:protein transport protein SEC23